jgi:hypothetical protein
MASIQINSLFDWLQYLILKPTSRRMKYIYLHLSKQHPYDVISSNHNLKDLGFTNNIKTSIFQLKIKNQDYLHLFFDKCNFVIKIPLCINITLLLPIAKYLHETNNDNWFLQYQKKKLEICYTENNKEKIVSIGYEINDAISLLQLSKIIKKMEYIINNKEHNIKHIDPVKSYKLELLIDEQISKQDIILPLMNGLDLVSKEITKYDWDNIDNEHPIILHIWTEKKTSTIMEKYFIIKYLTEFNTNDFTIYTYRPYFILFNISKQGLISYEPR